MNILHWKEKSIAERCLLILLILLNALFLAYWVALACNYQLHYDDAHFMWKMREFSIFEYVREMYMTRGGNFVGYGKNGVIFTIFNWIGDYHAAPIISYMIGILLVYGALKDWIKGYNKVEKFLGIIALYNVYVLTSIDVAVCMWLCAMGYYLTGPMILLFVKYFTLNKLHWWQWFVFVIIALFLSGSNVAITPLVLLIMFAIGMRYWHRNQWNVQDTWADVRVRRLIFTAIGMLCVYGIMVAAPGNYLRMDEFDIEQPANIAEFIKACCVCAGMFVYFMAFYLPYHMLTVAIGYIIGTKSTWALSLPKKRMALLVVGAFILYLGIAVMPLAYLSNGFQIQRNYTHICFFYQLMLFALGYIWGYKNTNIKIAEWIGCLASAFLIIIMCLNFHQDIPVAKAYNKAHQERFALLQQLQEQGNKETIVVKPYPSTATPDAKYTICKWLGKSTSMQAIYYEADTDVEPNEYEGHIRKLYHLDFDFVLPQE